MARKLRDTFGDVWVCKHAYGETAFYQHVGVYWSRDIGESRLRMVLGNTFKNLLIADVDSAFSDGHINEKQQTRNIMAIRQKLETYSRKQAIIKTAADYLRKEVEFDKKPTKFVTKNGVYDFHESSDEAAFGGTLPEEYVSNAQHAEFEYVPESECQMEIELLWTIINVCLPDSEARDTYLLFTATALFGMFVKNFLMCNGPSGNNGKTLLSTLALYCVGHDSHNYGTVVSEAIFTKKEADRASKAKLDRKRYGVIEEINKNDVLNGNEIKKMTGGLNFSARNFNSSKTENESHLTLTMNMNDECSIFPFDGAIRDRLIKIEFPNEFVRTAEEVDEARGKYLRNTLFSEESWLKEMRCPMFHILKKYLKQFLNGGKIIVLSAGLKQQRDSYLLECNDFNAWLGDVAHETGNKNEGIVLQDLKVIFKFSLYFQKLSKREQRKNVLKRLQNEVYQNENLRKSFKDRKTINGVGHCNVLWQWEFKSESHKEQYSLKTKMNKQKARISGNKRQRSVVAENERAHKRFHFAE